MSDRIFVAIDFGTSRSAIAISIRGRAEEDIILHTPKGSGRCPAAIKTETAVLLGGEYPHDFVAYGKTARKRFIKSAQVDGDFDDDDDSDDDDGDDRPGRPSTSGAPDMLFRYFKTGLCKNRGYTSVDQPVATAEGGEKLPLMTVMVAVLRHFKEDVLAFLSQHLELIPAVEDVNWVLTIPAIYDDFAKRFMRVAAHRAGIIRAVDDALQLQLCLEPEAACLDISIKEAPLLAQAGDKIMILDCGGGTVDITTHSVESRSPLRMMELVKATGGEWGSVCVDEMFMAWIRKLIGDGAYAVVRRTWEFYSLLDEWEEAKTTFQGEEHDTISLNMVDVVMRLGFDAKKLRELVAAHNADVEPALRVTRTKCIIELPSRLVRSFFAPTIDKIAKCLRSLRREPSLSDLKFVFLVGGFSACPLIEATARAELESEGCRVIVALRPEVAIVKGAVLFASNQSAFSRIAKLTYGVKSTGIYDPSNPEHVKRRPTHPMKDEAGKEVIHFFSTHIKRGACMPSDGTCPRQCYGPLLLDQTRMTIRILASHSKNIKFPDKDATFPLGEIIVEMDMTASFEDRGIEVEFVFNKAEIIVRCFRETTGERVGEVEINIVQEVQEV